MRIYSESAIHRRYFEKHWTTWCVHTPPKIRYSSNIFWNPIFVYGPNMGKFEFENPQTVTCFRVPMSVLTFSYKYNKPSNNRINIYGLLEHSIVYMIVCLFSLVCTSLYYTEFARNVLSDIFNRILQINLDVYFTIYPPASNVLSLASPAEYSSPLRLSIINYNIFSIFKVSVLIPQSVPSICRSSIHLLSSLSDRASYLLLFLSVSSVLKDYFWNKPNVSFTAYW